MKDVQSQYDDRKMAINKVGIKDISYPIIVLDKADGTQNTVASINMYVDLPHDTKGTHMSRFVEILQRYYGRISIKNMKSILMEMKEGLDAERAHISFSFPYFINKKAPVSGAEGLMNYQVEFHGECGEDNEVDFVLVVHVPVKSLCPCSKEISEYGAHNQRSIVTIKVRFKKLVWIEEMVALAEKSASSPLYSVIKRVDEKYVTEHSYDNPNFVEDIVRNVAVELNNDINITWFSVESENFESIHNHNAYAFIERDKVKNPEGETAKVKELSSSLP